MDRISQLPECIVHHILSFINMSPKDLIRMSVLSKNWFNLTASFPILDFNLNNHKEVSRQSFLKYVEHATSRFCHQNVTNAHMFKLITILKEPAESDIVNRCLDLVLKNGVRELVIDISYFPYVQKYRLPNILLSVSVLKSLVIRGCELPSSLMVDAIKFNSLVHLTLNDVSIDDEAIKYLTISCPLLQSFDIIYCDGFKRICVYGHQNLQKVRLYYITPLERIDIEAPNLSNLEVIDVDERGSPIMNLGLCKKLTTVTYNGHPLPNSNGFTDFLSNFPFTEILCLTTNYECNNLKLSSHTLRTLVLHSDYDLNDIEFKTPNLDLFIYSCQNSLRHKVMVKRWPLLRDSTRLKGCMQCYLDGFIDDLWVQKLRLFLDKKNGFKDSNLYIDGTYSQRFTELKKVEEMDLPPYELEHVELQLEDTCIGSFSHIAFVDALLWCCCPQSLTLRTSSPHIDFKEQSDVVKFTYDKLLEQVDQDHTSIQIVRPSLSEAQKQFKDLMSLSMGLPCEGKAITFVKEQVVQEEAG